MQVWCILKDSGDADVMDRTNTASRPFTVCIYPEVWISVVLVSSVVTFSKSHLTRKPFVYIFIFICLSSSIPQIFVLSGVIAMVTCAVFLRLNSLLKLAVLLLAVAVYSYLIHLAFLTLTRQDVLHRSRPTHSSSTQGSLYCFFTY